MHGCHAVHLSCLAARQHWPGRSIPRSASPQLQSTGAHIPGNAYQSTHWTPPDGRDTGLLRTRSPSSRRVPPSAKAPRAAQARILLRLVWDTGRLVAPRSPAVCSALPTTACPAARGPSFCLPRGHSHRSALVAAFSRSRRLPHCRLVLNRYLMGHGRDLCQKNAGCTAHPGHTAHWWRTNAWAPTSASSRLPRLCNVEILGYDVSAEPRTMSPGEHSESTC